MTRTMAQTTSRASLGNGELYGDERVARAADALPRRWQAIAIAAVGLAIAALAWTIAHWVWYWFGPSSVAFPAPVPDGDLSRRIADARLFGAPAATGAAVTPSGSRIADLSDLRLLGVFAQDNGGGYALFRSASRGALLVAVGNDVGAGLRLSQVRADGVTVVDAGGSRELLLRSAAPADKTRNAQVAAGGVAPGKSSACAAPPGFRGEVVRLNAELLSGMIASPNAWKALVAATPGALVVRDQSGFAGMLGLKNGDRVEKANGIALAIPDDIGATILQPLTRSQPVWLAGTRAGKPQQWLYLNTGACPA